MGIFDELQKASDEYNKLPDSRKPIIVGPSSKRLISDEELRHELEGAFDAGYDRGRINEGAVMRYFPKAFDDWYEEFYGGPDCE